VIALALLALGACASTVGARPPAGDGWALEERDAVRLEVVETLVDNKRYDAALDAIGALRQEGMDVPEVALLQARALSGKGLHTEAIGLLEHDRRGGDERLEVLGLARFGQRDLEGAIRDLRRAARRAAPSVEATRYNNLGFALAAAGEHREAIGAYNRALRLDPSLHRARNNMGFSLAALGRDAEALSAFEVAARAGAMGAVDGPDTARARAWYNLGLALALREENAEARRAWRAALEHDPDFSPAREALAGPNPPEEGAAPAAPEETP